MSQKNELRSCIAGEGKDSKISGRFVVMARPHGSNVFLQISKTEDYLDIYLLTLKNKVHCIMLKYKISRASKVHLSSISVKCPVTGSVKSVFSTLFNRIILFELSNIF